MSAIGKRDAFWYGFASALQRRNEGQTWGCIEAWARSRPTEDFANGAFGFLDLVHKRKTPNAMEAVQRGLFPDLVKTRHGLKFKIQGAATPASAA